MDSFNMKRNIPKLKESVVNKKNKQDSEEEEYPNLDYNYEDTDNHLSEISELYSYSEFEDYEINIQEFEKVMLSLDLKPSWHSLSMESKIIVTSKLLDLLEVSDKNKRMNAARCILYLLQGCWAECQSDINLQNNSKENVLFLYKFDIYNIFVNLLNMEIESIQFHRKTKINSTDSSNLRIILNVLYTFIEVLRSTEFEQDIEFKEFRENLLTDIGLPYTEEHIIMILFSMISKFCSGHASHYPIKKVLLLLWKLILVLLGGMSTLDVLKSEYRQNANLPELLENPIEIIKSMRSSSPPPNSTDLMNLQKRNTRQKRGLIKQSSLDESLMLMDLSYQNDEDLQDYEHMKMEFDDISNRKNVQEFNEYTSQTPPSELPIKDLPWIPKIRNKDLQLYLDQTRIKFLGFKINNDINTLIGLPDPIHESITVLKKYMYKSLADYQITNEENIQKNPLVMNEKIHQTPAEILYKAMLPNLPQYMISLLKILLAASPTSKPKNDSMNIILDILPVNMPMSFSESVRLETDINRQKEIIVKSISGILILLLKHFKINHIYQFEFICQHLVFANCIPLVIKFLNQNLVSYIASKNTISILEFPTCVLGQGPKISLESIEISEFPLYSWRNMFSCINLLRILNKIAKWKHSRIMMLVIFKSAPILKKSLKVRHPMLQLYILKLIKMQAKYLGRAWRKSNMKTISIIYQKVRHRLHDDWAFGNDLEARPTDFQIEERLLRSSVDKFHARRYSQQFEQEFTPSDFSIHSALGKPVELSLEYKHNYQIWLNQEVFQQRIDWELL